MLEVALHTRARATDVGRDGFTRSQDMTVYSSELSARFVFRAMQGFRRGARPDAKVSRSCQSRARRRPRVHVPSHVTGCQVLILCSAHSLPAPPAATTHSIACHSRLSAAFYAERVRHSRHGTACRAAMMSTSNMPETRVDFLTMNLFWSIAPSAPTSSSPPARVGSSVSRNVRQGDIART